MTTCFCCPKPRYKRLVDGLFPEDPQTPTPVSANMDKLLFFAQTSPDHLDNIGEYLALRLRRSLQRERNGHVSVALQVTEKLLSACDSRKLQLIVDSYLDILHNMLETSDTELHIMATNSFVKFAEREEGNTPYHRQYDFLIHRFASLSLTKNIDDADKYHETRMAGLQGLRGVIKKIGRQDNLQMNIWDLDHMNKIVPPFLFNMHSHSVAQRAREHEIQPVVEEGDSLGGYSQDSLTELITFAGLSHIDSVLKPILQHFDLNNLWISDKEFTAGVYVIVVEAMQRQDRYKAVQSLVDHLDAKVKESWETKQGILATLSQCVAVAADSSLGPSVLDIFRTLVRHLRISIETVAEGPSDLTSSLTFQQSITITVGEFAGVLPDYHKPDILGLINSYVPVPSGGPDSGASGTTTGLSAHPLAAQDTQNSSMLTTSLVKCLRAVADTCHASVLETAFPGQLFASLVQLLLIREPSTQLDVALLWHRLVDHHANKDLIPLNTDWVSLEAVGLSLGVVSKGFLSKTVNSLFTNLLELAKALCTSPANTLAFYQLVFLLTLEFSYQGLSDMLIFLHQLQELAVKEKGLEAHHRVVLHATVAGVLHLASKISRNEVLSMHIDGVIAKRRETAPRLLPDAVFVTADEMDGGRDTGGVVSEEEVLSALVDDEALLFNLTDVEAKRTSPPPSSGKLGHDSLPELSNHFSVSLDYGPESPLNVDQISFNNLKEKVEMAISGEEGGVTGGQGGVTGGQGEQSEDIVFQAAAGTDAARPDVSFEAMVGQSSRGDDSLVLSDLAEILNTSVTSPVPIPGATENLASPPQNAYDMELPSLH